MPRLIHLNGPPAIGKSTLARRYVAEHPGTLNCDIDRLRTMIGGWESDFLGVGERIRTSALAMIRAYLETDADVVVPQLVVRPGELARFRETAGAAGASYLCVLLTLDPTDVVRRFAARDHTTDPLLSQLHQVVATRGGDDLLRRSCRELDDLAVADPSLLRVASTDPDSTYAALLAALGETGTGDVGRDS
jgi:hypothetical protein